jgi:molybdate transport system substrate-binding protein
MSKRFAAALISFLLTIPAASADTLRVTGAGSLAAAFSDLLRRFPAGPDTVAPPEFGPSGLMREKIEAGADVDLFASADMAQAERLAAGHPERFVVNFTRNRLCAVARGTLGLTRANMLDRLLDPTVRLATSTPGADPAGDYAWAVFARAEATRAGARAALEAKALQLYGGGSKTPLLVPGKGALEGIFWPIAPMSPSPIAAARRTSSPPCRGSRSCRCPPISPSAPPMAWWCLPRSRSPSASPHS